ncbi:MAG: ATP-binding protein [Deltaproteobacteria bacterium]|nr:ATP-binding protein [Deltaproteobacteria bacterium]
MFETLIVDNNPHWDGTLYQEGVTRAVLSRVKDYLPLPHIIALVGVRRSGKSTLARQTINHLIRDKGVPPRNILFLNLENPQFSRYRNEVSYLEQAYNDYLKLVAPTGTVYCFLDEVHYFTEWQVFVKAMYEQKGIKFVVTGSNSHLLTSEFITILSGRAMPVEVYPFSFPEFVAASGLQLADTVEMIRERNRLRGLMDDYVQHGGFPEITAISEPTTKKEILVMYARNILYQDIAPRFAIKKAVDLENLFFYLASNISSLYSFNKLAALVGLSDKTVKDYIGYFSDAYLLFTLDAFAFSAKEQIRSPKKVYAIDTGLAGAVGFSFSENQGRLLENLLFLELKRRGHALYYYKTSNGLEVDFACHAGGKITQLIQVTYDMGEDRTRNRELRALVKALEETGLAAGVIITYEQEDEIVVDGKKISLIPAFKYLMT